MQVLLKHSEELRAIVRLYSGLGVYLSQYFSNSFLKGVVFHSYKVMLFRRQEHLLPQFLLFFTLLLIQRGLL